MIIVMNNNEKNLNAVKFLNKEYQFYPNMKLQNVKDEMLVLLDISMSESFSEISPRSLSDELISSGLPLSVKKIMCLVPNLNMKNSLTTFAQKMVDYLALSHQRKITIHVVTDINYAATVILAPESGQEEWSVYGIVNEPDHSKDLSAENLIKYYPHHLLWQGENICEWMEISHQRMFKSDLSERI